MGQGLDLGHGLHLALADWSGTGEQTAGAWIAIVSAGAYALLFAALVVRALVLRSRHRAVEVLDDTARAELRDEVAAAERRTVGEIHVTVLERCDRHPGAEWLAGVTTAVLGSLMLYGLLPWHTPWLVLLVQLALGAAGLLLARLLPAFKRIFVSETRATEMAEEQALQEFFAHDLYKTQARTGVLILVALLERRVVVLADEGIDARVDATTWEQVDDLVLAGIRQGSLSRGLRDGIERCATILETQFPWTEGDRNELPDHVVVRRE